MRVDLLAEQIYAEAVGRRLHDGSIADDRFASWAWDATATFVREALRRSQETGDLLHNGIPVDPVDEGGDAIDRLTGDSNSVSTQDAPAVSLGTERSARSLRQERQLDSVERETGFDGNDDPLAG